MRRPTSLRVGYLVPEFPGQTHIFFWREVEALRRIGEEVSLLSTRKPSPVSCRHEFAPTAFAETHYLFPPSMLSLVEWPVAGARGFAKALAYLGGLEASRFRDRLRQCLLFASALDLVRWSRREHIDHIHAHSCADAAHVLAWARCAGGPPYSLTLHGDLDVYGGDHRSKMEGAAFVSVVGNHLRHQVMERTGVPGERVFVTCMGVGTSKLATLGTTRSYAPGSLHLVTVARLNPAKGHTHVLAAIHRGLQMGLDLRYTIAGEGPYRDGIVSRVRELGLNSRVTLTGTLAETEVHQLLSEADAFILPSVGLGEAWPVSVMEAMGAGLPVIASIIGATPEMIIPGEDGFLVPQGDEQALLDKIVLLAGDMNIRRQIGEAARRTAGHRFDIGVTARALSDAIHASLDQGRCGARSLHTMTVDRIRSGSMRSRTPQYPLGFPHARQSAALWRAGAGAWIDDAAGAAPRPDCRDAGRRRVRRRGMPPGYASLLPRGRADPQPIRSKRAGQTAGCNSGPWPCPRVSSGCR